jgi:hypothetical protein
MNEHQPQFNSVEFADMLEAARKALADDLAMELEEQRLKDAVEYAKKQLADFHEKNRRLLHTMNYRRYPPEVVNLMLHVNALIGRTGQE